MPGRTWHDTKLGPRSTGLKPGQYEELGDPAGGEKVPRCGACGMPDPSNIVGIWRQRRVRFPLCPLCVARFNTPDPDPLSVEAGAA